MSLTSKAKQKLIAATHSLHPIIIIGNQGLSDSVVLETDRALFDHELIKVRILGAEGKQEKRAVAEALAKRVNAECLKVIGHVVILYRESHKKKAVPVVPNPKRNERREFRKK